ncbi:alpha/beta hydrolase fold protein [Cellulomonas fimi ATCC 484]|uniref:Alpha/beta hydrolase fold protein n=2 Tax=Cellulomonas fimi TaxID=1708 RepID=F4GYH2_CELFA|nr:alpha/beta hydrolase fold protein [Cellulomonas fimi ATCC 484]VEH35205.1 acetoin dehydrogenase E2 subunit dihydrolipoyllysine-residue acetyltransferase [Cellulomonas fimi]
MPGMRIQERGTGTPVVLVHGFGVDHRILLPLDPVIADHGGWRRLYVDLPWVSPRADGTPVASTEDVARVLRDAVVDRLGDEPFAVVGNSYGGMLARRLAHDLRDQVLGLATVAGLWEADDTRRTVPPRTVLHADPAVLAGVDATLADGYAEMAVVQSAAGLADYRRWVQPGVDAADPAVLDRLRARYPLDVDPEDASPAPFTAPTLVLCGRQDQVVGYADAFRRLDHYPRAAFVVLDAAGHNVHLDQPAASAAALTTWLDEVRRWSGSRGRLAGTAVTR